MNLHGKIEVLKEVIIYRLKKDLISLYLVGSVLNPNEMTRRSDIDIWGIVKDDFDFNREEKLLEYLRNVYNKKYNIDGRFRAITISELYGGKQKGLMTKYIPINVLFKTLLHGQLLYGRNLNLSKSPVKDMNLFEEIEFQTCLINEILSFQKIWYPRKLLKLTFYLAKVEAEIKYKYQWEPSYNKILSVFANQKNHVIHLANKLRRKRNITEKDLEEFYERLENYTKQLKQELLTNPRR